MSLTYACVFLIAVRMRQLFVTDSIALSLLYTILISSTNTTISYMQGIELHLLSETNKKQDTKIGQFHK